MGGFKLTLFANADAVKPDLKCTSCSCVLDRPVGLPCGNGDHLVCLSCLRNPRGRQRLFRCRVCDQRVGSEFAASAAENEGVPNWVRVQLNSLRLSCPKRCGIGGLKIADLARHYATECGKTEVTCANVGCGRVYKRELEAAHLEDCNFRRVECRICKKAMLNKDLLSHQVKTRCNELEVKLARKQCMKHCNKEVLDHYRLLRERSLASMQEFRRTELSHLQRMGVQGFVRREPLPLLACLSAGDAAKRCDRCGRMYNNDTNHEMACRWHGGPIIQTFGGLCLACGKPSHTEGCIISAHLSSVSLSNSSNGTRGAGGLGMSSAVHVKN